MFVIYLIHYSRRDTIHAIEISRTGFPVGVHEIVGARLLFEGILLLKALPQQKWPQIV